MFSFVNCICFIRYIKNWHSSNFSIQVKRAPCKMTSPRASLSPKFKNVCIRQIQSPQEIKERIRKNYKIKVQNCRGVLLDRFRGEIGTKNLCDITEFYKNMFNFPIETSSEEESELLEQLKNELLEEEIQWWLNEYEKSQMEGIDWSVMEQNNNVICPICQKENLTLTNENLTCSLCKNTIKTDKSLVDIQTIILSHIEQHNTTCSHEPQFSVIPDSSGDHMYLICEFCNEMKSII